jgi:hypothetical protein
MPESSDFCLDRAAECARGAAAADLPNVRARWLRSEAAWRARAEHLLKAKGERERLAAQKAAQADLPGQ